jgi:hypothetical protein
LKEARACAEEVDHQDAKAADIIDTVTAFENKTIKLGGEEEKAAHFKLLYYVVDHKAVEIAGCIICPACLRDTPAKYSVCLRCMGMMISHGRRPFIITEDEREDTPGDPMDVDDESEEHESEEATKKNDDEYRGTVEEAKREAATNDYAFDESEVDWDDDDANQDMEVDAEGTTPAPA